MNRSEHSSETLTAVVHEVMPEFGIAYACDENSRSWGITKSTAGPGLKALRPGRQVSLVVQHHREWSIAQSYSVIDAPSNHR